VNRSTNQQRRVEGVRGRGDQVDKREITEPQMTQQRSAEDQHATTIFAGSDRPTRHEPNATHRVSTRATDSIKRRDTAANSDFSVHEN
jgi:hypothetical protein